MQRSPSTHIPNSSAPRQSPHGDRGCLVPNCRKKTCYAGFGSTRIYSRYCFKHTCPKVVPIEDGYHCPMAKTKEGQPYCDNHMACAAPNCNELGTYPDDETALWHCHRHRCTKDGCKDGAIDTLSKRCKNHQECAALHCEACPDSNSFSSFCFAHTCSYDTCPTQAVANRRCFEHSKCGIPSCEEPCKVRPDGRLETLCETHMQLKCAKPGCGSRKFQNHHRYCLEHSCRLDKCANERDESGGTLCTVHKCTANDCFNPIANPDNHRSLFCSTHACRENDCLYSLQRPSSFCDKHTCKRADCIKRAASGPDSFCDAHRNGPCKVDGCHYAAWGNDSYCKNKHGCVEAGCQKPRLSMRLGDPEEGEDDLVRCLRHDRQWQANQWKEKYERLLADYENLKLGKRRGMQATVEDDTEEETLC
ncbi:hypothetical protein QBC34DRAFT_401790 [Podospora aff. communis PSN243]|uniref:Uncharacterized protein n=1 Tax=Podospora aff. communis PSN243 TaxID=3040156 RepID=A0AAV9GTY6_9PEZI|nr:hypothetical protein QBC34DRAFT_401790 [Podospora aff. communis PSN243]